MSAKSKLTPRQKRAAEAFVGPAKGEKKRALEMAGYPASVAATKQGREWTPDMQQYVRELMDKEGISDAYMVKQHKALFKATAPVTYKGRITARYADHGTRYNALKLAMQAKGWLKPDVDVAATVNIVVQSVTQVILTYVPKAKQDAAFADIERTITATPDR